MKKTQLTVIFAIILLLICVFNIESSSTLTGQQIGSNMSVVKVLVYYGMGRGEVSVNDIKKGLKLFFY